MPSLGDLVVSFSANTENLTSGISQAKTSFSAMDEVARLSAANMAEALGRPVQSTRDLALAASNAASSIDSSLGGVKQEISSVADAAESTSTSFLGHFGKMAGGILDFGSKIGQTVFGVQNLANTAENLGSALLGPASQLEQMTTSFTTLDGSTSAATAELQKLNAFAAKTPFQTADIDQAAASLQAFGVKSSDVIPDLTGMGDALSSMGKVSGPYLDQIVLAFGHIQSEGKLTGRTVNELGQLGINAMQMLQNATGKSRAELQKMIANGTLPAKEAIADLTKGIEKSNLGGGMAKQAQTAAGQLSTLHSNINLALAAFGGPLLKAAEGGLSTLGSLVASPNFQKFAGQMGTEIVGALGKAGTAIQNAGKFLSTALLLPLEHLGKALEPIVKPIADWAVKNDVLGKSLSGIATIVGALVTGLGTLIDALATVVSFFEQNQVAADILVGVLAGLAAILLVMSANAILAAITSIPALLVGFGAWIIAAGAAAIATIAATWPLLLIGAVVAAVVVGIILAVQHWSDIMKWLQGVIGAVTGAVGGFFSGLGSTIHGIIDGIGNAFSGLGSLVHSVWDGIVGSIKGAINAIIGGIDQFIGAVNGIHITIPHIDAGPIHIGGGSIGFPQIPLIPKLSSGVENFQGGLAYVHKGEMLSYLPQGTNVSRAGSGGGGDIHVHNHIYLDGKEVTNQVMTRAMKEIRRNGGRAA